MGKISFDINSGQKITLEQAKHDCGVVVTKTCGKAVSDATFTISPSNMMTLLNYYQIHCLQQKE